MKTDKQTEVRHKGSLDHKEVREMLAQGARASRDTKYPGGSLGDDRPLPLHDRGKPNNRSRRSGKASSPFEPDASKKLFRAYVREVGRIPLLNKEEERELAKEIQEGQRELVRRLLKMDLKTDEINSIIRKDRNLSDESLANLLGTLERLEKGNKISPDKRAFLSEVRKRYRRLSRLKGEMLRRNLRLVISIAKGFKYSGIGLSDLIQEGNLGLMKAVSKFDYRRGYKFGTYATWWIRQAIQRAIVEKGRIIRVPVHLVEERQKLRKTYGKLLEERGRVPHPQEIAKKAKVPLGVVHKALFDLPETISLETPVGENTNLAFFIEDENSPSPFEVMKKKEIQQMAEKLLAVLPPREAEILRLRFGIGGYGEHTLEEIGRKFGISRERVRQLEGKGINRLRHPKRKLSPQAEGVP
ncbi:MAG: RNA polymerase sigma factor RpoD/SigA [Thermodesulfobacteriota bacterium]